MSGIFLSYSREDRVLAGQIIRGLRALGVVVWWDEDMRGVDWQEELERQISALAGVLVLWTGNSAASKNVKDEARLGLETEKLLNVISGIPKPPFPYDRVNGLPLDGWDGREPHKGWTRLVQTVESMLVRANVAQPGEITGALAEHEKDLRQKQQAVGRAQLAFQQAQAREEETADAARAAAANFERAEEQHRRVVEMRPGALILNGAQAELDVARAARDEAEHEHRAAQAKLSDASRALSRAKTALEKLLMVGAEPSERPPMPAPMAAQPLPTPPALETPAPPSPTPDPPRPGIARRRSSVSPVMLWVGAGVIGLFAIGAVAALHHPGPKKLSPADAAAAAAADQQGDADLNSNNYADALSQFNKAADDGDPGGQYGLGWIYQNGFGVAQDYGKAMYWYRLAAAQNHAQADAQIGWLYENGLGVPIDYVEAMKWFRLAAAQGNPLAQNEIGVMYAEGHGVAQDYVEAMKWFRFAAAQSWATSEGWIGYLYANGYGVDQNTDTARSWYAEAAAGGDETSKTWLAQNPQ